jgi:hypothetical protein
MPCIIYHFRTVFGLVYVLESHRNNAIKKKLTLFLVAIDHGIIFRRIVFKIIHLKSSLLLFQIKYELNTNTVIITVKTVYGDNNAVIAKSHCYFLNGYVLFKWITCVHVVIISRRDLLTVIWHFCHVCSMNIIFLYITQRANSNIKNKKLAYVSHLFDKLHN